MKACQMLIAASMDAGVASNLINDLMESAAANNESLKRDQFPKLAEIKARLKQAAIYIDELETMTKVYENS